MTEKRILRSIDDVRDWCNLLYQSQLPMRVAMLQGVDRTLDQNALVHKWFAEVAHQSGESASEVKARAKLDFGCPILCRDDPVFMGFFHHAISPLSRERQIKSMAYVSVTSDMTVKQMSEFMDEFERHHRAAGMVLTIPEDDR
jgi:hypothetical protein